MKKVAYTNTGATFAHVGSVMIPPGETRDVDASLVPGAKAVPKVQTVPETADPLAEVLSGTVKQIAESLDQQPDEALVQLAALEQSSAKPRASLLEAIAAEQLKRAGQAG